MSEAFICDFARTPIGRYEGGFSRLRADDLAAAVIKLATMCVGSDKVPRWLSNASDVDRFWQAFKGGLTLLH